ncbi:MAG: NAD(P)-dependent alcohol dehydrogenase [Myxococcales bacterium]|nr:NAD(P)-dependent alcohol dehydrogenase [Myxococcales bacterium]
MKAIIYDRYGAPDVLELRELAPPVAAGGEVLVRVRAAALNPKDSLIRKGKFKAASGPTFPKLLGYDVAGVVEALGAGITKLRIGDEVFGMRNGFTGGTVAELVTLQETELCLKPVALTFEEAAALPLTSLTALQALRDLGGVGPGARVLIHGASGGVGVVAVQLAKALGATVTTTCSEKNLEFVRSLGADETLDYTKETGLEPGRDWSCVFDVFGNRRFSTAKASLGPRGVYVSTVPSVRSVFDDLRTRWLPFKKSRLVVVKSNTTDLEALCGFVERGQLKPIIDRVVPLAETAAGQAHVETKRARGKVVISVS